MLICPNCKAKFKDEENNTICPICRTPIIETDEENITTTSKSFVKSSDKYEDLNSSGITLIITSIAGFVFMILKALDIIPLYFEGFSEYMFYAVMGTMFIAFMVMGIKSLKKAKTVRNMISSEENTTSEIIDFFTENYDSEQIDNEIDASSLSEGEAYYKRYDFIKSTIQSNFENIDDSFAEHLVEEVYQNIYE